MIGIFDGVHVGHQELIRETVAISRERDNWAPAALTFDPHPASVFGSKSPPLLIDTFDDRLALLARHGVEHVIVARFDRALAEETAEDFVRRVLVETLSVGAVVVGEDFRFGRDRIGDIETLRRAGELYDFVVSAVPQVYIGDIPVRSTEIRSRIRTGVVNEATALLGRPFTLRGEVVHGRQLGRTIGFPTANLAVAPGVITPGPGVFAGRAEVGGEFFGAAISVGVNPTVAPEGVTLPETVEAYLLEGFNRDVYGQTLRLEFYSRIRGMEKFSGIEELVSQMREDVREVERRLVAP